MSWIVLTLFSALFLGLYDICKKAALRDNSVAAVLFLSVTVPALLWLPWILLSKFAIGYVPHAFFVVQPLGVADHLALAFKSILVGSSWMLAYAAIKHLPISIASPVRATSPIWTAIIATMFMAERPTGSQWLGVAVILLAFYGFSFAGSREGIHFTRNKWVGCMVLATMLSSCCALYDKWLLQTRMFDASTLQAWFSVYLVPVMLPILIHWRRQGDQRARFKWTFTIALIGVFLLVADFAYFSALRQPDALISLVSPLRRTSVIVSIVAGAGLFKERNVWLKAVCAAALLLGVYIMSW